MTFQISTILFVAITLAFFYLINPGYRWILLTAASLFFVFMQDKSAGLILILITLFTYWAGAGIGRLSKKEGKAKSILLGFSVIVFVALFLFWKLRLSGGMCDNIIMPIGFSFYSFQAISYLADIHGGKRESERNPIRFLLYMSWFPKFVSGPIERSESFIPQTGVLGSVRLTDPCRIRKALAYLIWGLFMKLMIADRAGIIVDNVFVKPNEYGSLMLMAGVLLYTIQIYCDFAGYTNIAIGVSVLFGLKLTQNFRTPYFTENISDFWKSWHITLSSFLRDYIYIPLGGNRRGKLRRYLNIMIVFLVCGLWHGRGLKFIAWGVLHGFYSIVTDLLKGTRMVFLIRGVTGKIVTFCCVAAAWVFFRAESLRSAADYLFFMFTAGHRLTFEETLIKAGTDGLQLCILTASVLAVFVLDLAASKKKSVTPELLMETGEVKRDLAFVLLTVIILIFGIYGNLEVKEFIYKDF